jgi:thiamine pyrophosphokinase
MALKALVLGAGAPPPPELVDRHIAGARMVVCADGAVNWARAMGLMPDAVVGDMDSVRPEALDELECMGVHLARLSPRKNETDAQEAVDYALRAGANEIVLLGMSGCRLDHTVANIHLLVRIAMHGAFGRLCDAHNEVYAACTPITLHAKRGTMLSILPLSGSVAIGSLEGLEYPLNDYVLRPEFPRAISNVFIGDTARVNILEGWAAIFLSID